MEAHARPEAVRPYLLNIPERLYNEVERLAKEKKQSRKEVIVYAIKKMMLKDHT